MGAGELPLWASSAGIVGTVIGTSILAIWQGRKAKPASAPVEGEAQILAAAFIEKQLLVDLTSAVKQLDGTARVLIQSADRIYDELHEEALIRAAAARIRRDDHDR